MGRFVLEDLLLEVRELLSPVFRDMGEIAWLVAVVEEV